MLRLVSGAIFSFLVWRSDLGVTGAGAGGVACDKLREYRSGSFCCLNCPAGTYMTAACTAEGQLGTCWECEDGTFMEHTNHMKQCFPCKPCRSDQEEVTACTHTLNAVCRCAPGRFCDPEQPCELCKKCSSCGPDGEAVRNCTPTADTECKRVQSTSAPPAENVSMIVFLTVVSIVVFIATVAFCVWKHCRGTASPGSSAEQKPGQDLLGGGREGGSLWLRWPGFKDARQLVRTFSHTQEEHETLRDSCTSTASNSQYSLTGLTSCPAPAPPLVTSLAVPPRPPSRDEEPFPPLVAVNGEASLRCCFEYFEELNIDYSRKFFRRLNVNDNVIKSKEELPYEDRIHDLLHIWMEKEGRGASLDQLLQVLLDLNQRRTAENIKEQAVQQGHYLCEGEPGSATAGPPALPR